MKVTVICLAYNHEKFLEDTLRGFVRQITDFPFEVLVGEDASTDGTAAIVKKYADLHPDIIKPVFRPRNVGGGENYRDLYSRVNSEYVILCEGDDHWCHDRFLQMGADFLDAHPDCVMFAGNTLCDHIPEGWRAPLIDYIGSGWFGLKHKLPVYTHLSARLFRHRRHIPFGDAMLHHYLMSLGPCYYLHEVVSVYTITGQGVWTSRPAEENRIYNLRLCLTLNKFFGYRHDDVYTKILFPDRGERDFWTQVKQTVGPEHFWSWYAWRQGGLTDLEIQWLDEQP